MATQRNEAVIRDNLQLLKLHMQWPERARQMGLASEAEQFFAWLQEECVSLTVVNKLQGVGDVGAFIEANRAILGRSSSVRNARQEPRLETSLPVLINVSECPDNSNLVGMSSRCTTIDLGMHGMRVRSSQVLPRESTLKLTVAPVGFPITMYDLVGDPRWVASEDDGCEMGIRIEEREDFDRWKAEFDNRFVARR